MKRCTKCGVEKPLSEFFSQTKTGSTSRVKIRCNACSINKRPLEIRMKHREYQRKYVLRNKENVADSWKKMISGYAKRGLSISIVRIYGAEKALEVYQKFNRKCFECDSPDDLTIHHIDNNGINNIEKGDEPNNAIENLVLLCRRCHGRIHGKQSQTLRKEGGYINNIGIPKERT